MNEIDPNLADSILDAMGVLGDFGVQDPTLTLKVSPYPSIELSITGTPLLPGKSNNMGDIETFFYDLFDGLTFTFNGKLRSLELASIRLEAAMDPTDVSSSFALKGSDGLGPNIFYQYEIISLPFKPGLSTLITTFGMTLPMTICVAKCETPTPDTILLEGTIHSSMQVGGVTPPATTIGGLLSLVGVWTEPFGIPILNVNNIIAGIALDVSKPFPANIASVLVGADVCLGSGQACTQLIPIEKNFISGAAYINLNMNVPSKNFFFAMISSMTIEHVLKVASVLEPSIEDLIKELPSDVRVSGITPFNEDNPQCETLGNKTAQMLGEEKLNLDCYVYFIVSPLATNEIESLNLEIPRGISFGGKLNLFNRFVARMEAKVR